MAAFEYSELGTANFRLPIIALAFSVINLAVSSKVNVEGGEVVDVREVVTDMVNLLSVNLLKISHSTPSGRP
jgi:hypothetical protein